MNIEKNKRNEWSWYDIDFVKAKEKVLEYQREITLAYEEKDLNRVKQLQDNLVGSWSGIYVAVQTVTTNKGRNTPGVDKVTWRTTSMKEQAVLELKALTRNPKAYKPKPVRRVEILKVGGKKRSLGILTMIDRAYQTLWNLALVPIAECVADERSYGRRPFRSAQDCLTYLWLILVPRRRITDNNPYTWVFDADIKGYFDNISHRWLLDNIPMNQVILEKWLKAGVMTQVDRNWIYTETKAGVPQGGPISSTIANMVLDGLQKLVQESTQDIIYRALKSELRQNGKRKSRRKMNVKTHFVRYVDDFLVICKSKKIIENRIVPVVEDFLQTRGLKLNLDKTKIISTKDGFNYVGFSVRMEKCRRTRHGTFLKIKPSQENIKEFKMKVKTIVRKYNEPAKLIQELNPVLRGWINYYKSVHSKRIFSSLDYYITQLLRIWAVRKYRGQNAEGKLRIFNNVFKRINGVKWRFVAKTEKGEVINTLVMMSKTPIERHFIAKDGLNPYKTDDRKVLLKKFVLNAQKKNVNRRMQDVAKQTKFVCAVCGEFLDIGNKSIKLHIHHVVRRSEGGTDHTKNLRVLHENCHMQVTHTKCYSNCKI